MRRNIKHLLVMCIAFFLCLQCSVLDTKAAANVVIGLSSGEVSIGDGVTATISVSGDDISAYTIYVSYDSSVLQYNSASGSAIVNGGGGTVTMSGTASGSISISFSAIANGTASISTSGSDVYDINGSAISISHAGASVKVETQTTQATTEATTEAGQTTEATTETTTEEDERSSNCDLSSLQVSPGNLSPSFSASTTYYEMQVDEDVTSIVVSATAADSKASTSVYGADSIKKGENTITVTVTAENGAVKMYNIRVVAGEDLGDPEAVIDGKKYSFIKETGNLEIPEGFTETTAKYKNWDVLAFESPNKKVLAVCLEDENGEKFWFIMDAENDSFTPYQEYSSDFNRYMILPLPKDVKVPEGFEPTTLKIGDKKIDAYQSAGMQDKDIYLIYAVNLEGDEGFYIYDTKERAFLRYVPMIVEKTVTITATPTQATPTQPTVETKIKTKNSPLVIGLLIGFGFVIVLMIVCIVIFVNRINKQNRDLSDADDMLAQLVNVNRDVNPELIEKLGLSLTPDEVETEQAESSADETEEQAEEQAEEQQTSQEEILLSEEENSATTEAVESEKPQEPESVTADEEKVEEQPSGMIAQIEMPDVDAIVSAVNASFERNMEQGLSYVEKSEKELAHEDYEKRSEEINHHLKTDYDMSKDSIFADDEQELTKK